MKIPGIDIESSEDCRINCNEITDLPWSFHFLGFCDGSLLRANVMEGYDDAIRLTGATLPDQFQTTTTVPADEEPLDNVWNDPPQGNTQATDRVVETPGSGVIGFNWYYRTVPPGPNQFNPLDNGTTSPFLLVQQDDPGTVDCNDQSDRKTREVKYGRAVGDSLAFEENEDENTWFALKYAYTAMRNDLSILEQDPETDGDYQDFYEDMEASNIGSFARVNEMAIYADSIDEAATFNESINDGNDLEYYLKETNAYYLLKVAAGLPLSGSDTAALEAIAALEFFTGGESIYSAAAMLGLEITPSVSAGRLAFFGNHQPGTSASCPKSPSFQLFPNPASGPIFLEGPVENIREIVLSGCDGKFIGAIEYPYTIQGIQPGMYYLNLVEYDEKKTVLKLVVIK